MRIRVVEVTRRFEWQYQRLPKRVRAVARERERIFRENPFDPRLRVHKLHGKEREAWVFSIAQAYRIKFVFLSADRVLFLEVGTHDIYRS